MKYEAAFKKNFSAMRVFGSGDARRFLGRMGASDSYVRLFLHHMAAKKEIFRLSRGYYSFSDSEALSGFAFRPFYYGLGYALTIRGIWTQQANPVIITTTKTRAGSRTVLGHSVTVRRISQRGFFGFGYVRYAGTFVPVSTVEKTLLDFMHYGIGLDTETRAALVRASDRRIVAEYARMFGGRTADAEKAMSEERHFEGFA